MFYTYLWLRYDGTPYYVGKGTGYRAYAEHLTVGRPPKERILVQEFPTEEEALAAEQFLIAYYGRKDLGTGVLRNYTDGGEGVLRPNKDIRERMRDAHKGHTTSEETKNKMSISHLGRKMSESHLENHKKAQASPELRAKKSKALKGKPWTATRRKAHIPIPIVSFYKPYGKWRVRESITGKHLGYFVTEEEAREFAE